MVKRIPSLIICTCFLLTCTGCWNNKDLSELSILTALGLDKSEDGRIIVTAQIIKPSAIGLSNTGSSGGAKKSFVVLSDTEETIFAALRNMLAKVDKRISYSSSQIIVLGESLAKSGLGDYLDFILRDHETQYKSLIAVAKGTTARKILEQEYDITNLSGAFLRDTFRNTQARAFTKKLILLDMARELTTEGRELSLGTVEQKEKTTVTEGLAIFKSDKLTGWLNKYDTRGYLFMTDRVKSTIMEIENPINPKKKIGLEVIKSSSKIEANMVKKDTIEITINIKTVANIGEQHDSRDMNEYDIIKKVDKNFSRAIEQECVNTLYKCQKVYKSDIFGFGMRVFDKYPKYWKSVSKDWNDKIFPNVKVKFNIEVKINRTGLLLKTLEIR